MPSAKRNHAFASYWKKGMSQVKLLVARGCYTTCEAVKGWIKIKVSKGLRWSQVKYVLEALCMAVKSDAETIS
jgi:hypothetical protein